VVALGRFRAYRVFGASGGAPTAWITAAMVAAADDGVDVISMSLGGYDAIAGGTWTDPDTGIVYRIKDVADGLDHRFGHFVWASDHQIEAKPYGIGPSFIRTAVYWPKR
jgi:hypothetical protein